MKQKNKPFEFVLIEGEMAKQVRQIALQSLMQVLVENKQLVKEVKSVEVRQGL